MVIDLVGGNIKSTRGSDVNHFSVFKTYANITNFTEMYIIYINLNRPTYVHKTK